MTDNYDRSLNDLLADMRVQVQWSDKASTPIPLYERMKAVIISMGDATSPQSGEINSLVALIIEEFNKEYCGTVDFSYMSQRIVNIIRKHEERGAESPTGAQENALERKIIGGVEANGSVPVASSANGSKDDNLAPSASPSEISVNECGEWCPNCGAHLRAPKRELGGWQPINTAPRDGTEIWIAHEHYKPTLARWLNPKGGRWFVSSNPGFWPEDDPSHWMPRPEFPNNQIEGGN